MINQTIHATNNASGQFYDHIIALNFELVPRKQDIKRILKLRCESRGSLSYTTLRLALFNSIRIVVCRIDFYNIQYNMTHYSQ